MYVVKLQCVCVYFQTIECYLRAILNVKGASDKLYQLSHYTTGVILNGTREQLAQQRLRKVSGTLVIFLSI